MTETRLEIMLSSHQHLFYYLRPPKSVIDLLAHDQGYVTIHNLETAENI